VLSAAAALLSEASTPDHAGSLEAALLVHASSLQSPSRHLRTAALRWLCAVAEASGESLDLRGVAANDTITTLGQVLTRWLDINAHDAHDVEKGGNVLEFVKTSQVAVAAMRRGVEGGTVTEAMVEPLTRCALGALHVRLAPLWPEVIKLLGAMTAKTAHAPAWDALFAEVEALQGACLDAHDAAAAAVESGDDRSKHHKRNGKKHASINDDGGGSGSGGGDMSTAAAALSKRMTAAVNPVEAGTERWARYGLLLRAVAASPQVKPYTLHPIPYTLHPAPYTLHSTLYTPYPIPYTLYPLLNTLHPTPHTLHPTPFTLHPTIFHTLHPTFHALHPTFHTLHPTFHTLHSISYTLDPPPSTFHPTTLNPKPQIPNPKP